jgi:hypothetical protein
VKNWAPLLLACWLALPASGALLTDRIDWGSTGGSYDMVSNPTTATSAGGRPVTVSQAGAAFLRLDQGDGWSGNFSSGDHLLWTYFGGPMTLDFGPWGATAIRFQIAPDLYEAFSAQLELVDGAGGVVGRVTGSGQSNSLGDGSALLLSFSGALFHRARIQLVAGSDLSSFAINAVEFHPGAAIVQANAQQAGVPEPGTWGLAAIALAALAVLHRRAVA